MRNNIQGDYLNFDLLITRAGKAYRVYVIDAPGGDADALFTPPFSPQEIGRVIHERATQPGFALRRENGSSWRDLRTLGSRLYDALFHDDVRAVLVASQVEAAAAGCNLRIRLRFSHDAANLATIPWEILFDPEQQHFLALSESRTILRYLSLPRSRPVLLVQPPLTILALLASPTDHVTLDVGAEWQALQTALLPLCADHKVTLQRLTAPTFAALQSRFLGEPVHVLHFVGHGTVDAEGGAGALLFEDEQQRGQWVSAKSLAMLLHNHPSLRLVYLNACEGAIADEKSGFVGVAQTLVQQGVPAAVAMQDAITDGAAIEIARTFYTALATGRPVDAALTQARVALAAQESDEWVIPTLFSRSPDNRLFELVAVLPTPTCPYPGMRPFHEEQADCFFGREREIEEAVNRLAQHPFLTVIGPSGSGKSSLAYAGIIPHLKQSRRFGDGRWIIWTMRPSDSRTAVGSAAPTRMLMDFFSDTDGQSVQALTTKRLLLIDQFEELFTLADPAEAKRFLAMLHELIGRPNLYILLTVRADFYPEMMASGALWGTIRANRLELTPLGDDELWTAIVQPAARVGVTVDEALVVALIADAAGEAGLLPLMQETLVLLWEKVTRRELKLKAYQSMADGGRSGIQVAIDRRATTVYHHLPDNAKPIARRIFLRLIQFGAGRADTRRQQPVFALRTGGGNAMCFEETLQRLVESRLLTTSGEEGDPNRRVDISHEALIGGWRLLQGWIQAQREAEATRRRLEEKARDWLRLGKSGGLLDTYELHEAQEWLAQTVAEELGISEDLLQLISASEKAISANKAAEEAFRQRELETARQLAETESERAKAEATSARRLRWMLLATTGTAFALLLLLTIVITPQVQEWRAIAAAKGPLIPIQGGPTMIGIDSPEAEAMEQPPWIVTLTAFQIEQFEVTNYQYALCVRHNQCAAPAPPDDFYDPQKSQYPVTYIDAVQAANYCRWLGRRLPTELEWERAARGLDGRPWPWAEDGRSVDSHSNIRGGKLYPVTSYPNGRSAEGVYHLWGNVWEWTSSYYQDYRMYDPNSYWNGDPATPVENTLVVRGNGANGYASLLITTRSPTWIYYKADDLGFRCVEQ